MPELVTSLWTNPQIVLTVLIAGFAAILAREPVISDRPPGEVLPARPAAWRYLFIATLALVAAYLVCRAPTPLGVRMDSYSEANVVVSGRNYTRIGFAAFYGAPQHQVVSDTNPPDPFYVYTKYPAAPNLLFGAFLRLGGSSLTAYRMLPAACSLLSAWLWYGIYRRYTGECAAALAGMAMATSLPFLAYADNIYFYAYALLAHAAAVSCFVTGMTADGPRRRRWFITCGGCVFILAMLTWEHHLGLIVFMALHSVLFACPIRRRYLLLFLIPLALAGAVQGAQRRLCESTIRKSAEDAPSLLETLRVRTIGFQDSLDTPQGLTLRSYPTHLLLAIYRFYGLPAVAAALLLVLAARAPDSTWYRPGSWPPAARLALILTAAGVSWWAVMLQHTSVHPHVMRHALPAYALLVGLTLERCGRIRTSAVAPRATRIVAVALAITVLCPQLEGTLANIRLHFDETYFDARGRNDAGWGQAGLFSQLQHAVPAGGVILTNLNRLPILRACSSRPVYLAPNVKLPGGDPANNRRLLELAFNHLRELYQDKLPPLYYFYHSWRESVEASWRADPFFRFMLLGNPDGSESAWEKARPLLGEAQQSGSSSAASCPIIASYLREFYLIRLDPAVPALREEFAPLGFPTQRQFGPIP
jgi:hypothetical protein